MDEPAQMMHVRHRFVDSDDLGICARCALPVADPVHQAGFPEDDPPPVTAYRSMRHGEHVMTETDQQRLTRTSLSSVRMTDDESKKVQKTPNRVTLDWMLQQIVDEEIWHPRAIPHMTVLAVKLVNGFVVIGQSTPADPNNFDAELGIKFAKEDAIRQMWRLYAFMLRERMTQEVSDGGSKT